MKVKIIYTSLTGNTQEAVDVLTDALDEKGAEVDVLDSEDGIEVDDFFTDADAYVLASYSDGDNGELPDGIVDFSDDLTDFDLSGKKVAVIGTGDSSYDEFCGAVDILEKQVRDANATLIAPSLKIENAPDDDAIAELEQLAQTLTTKVAE
ncbi:flavodoxin domain-containing protein [Lentilactobacillus raoultii]|uniref:Flavodoxin domain-containing protein n=1 Tax=Lentilactobacillus raoultii TaxID=1987503 RepID=A0ABW3PFV1_9LACO|nr:flavodoxin domain-containing protein [Lentilactobacillus raoultii]